MRNEWHCTHQTVRGKCNMTTLVTVISNEAIKSNKDSVTVTQLRDPKASLYFRYSKVSRDKGVFYARIYRHGKDQMVRIGKYPQISTKNAKQAIPNIYLREEYFNHNEITDMDQLCEWYIARLQCNRQISIKTAKQTVSMIRRQIKPYLAHLSINEIDIGSLDLYWYSAIQSKLALSTISLALVTLNAMFTWATKLQLISKNPVIKLSLANFTHRRPKIKVCKLNEAMLEECLSKLMGWPIEKRVLLILMLSHGTRIGETTKARWDAFDFERLIWRIPASDTKTKKPHILPLSLLTVIWLKAYRSIQYRTKRSKYLFPQKNNNRKPQSVSVSSRTISNMAKGQWSAHDIRKYARSAWLENGVDYIIGELLLNHSLSKLDQSYIQTTAMNLCREALVQWSESLKQLGLTEPSFNKAKKQ